MHTKIKLTSKSDVETTTHTEYLENDELLDLSAQREYLQETLEAYDGNAATDTPAAEHNEGDTFHFNDTATHVHHTIEFIAPTPDAWVVDDEGNPVADPYAHYNNPTD